MDSAYEDRELIIWPAVKGNNGFYVPFPNRIIKQSVKISGAELESIKKDQACVLIYPMFPHVGVLAKVKILSEKEEGSSQVELTLLRRVVIDSVTSRNDCDFCKLEPFVSIPIPSDEFKTENCKKIRAGLISIVAETLALSDKAKYNFDTLYKKSSNPENFEKLIDILASCLWVFPDNSFLRSGLIEVLVAPKVLARAERLRQLYCWIYVKLKNKEDILADSDDIFVVDSSEDSEDPTGDEAAKKADKDLPEKIREIIEMESKRLAGSPESTLEAGVIRQYLYHLRAFPWTVMTEDQKDFALVGRILDEDHYGLNQVKSKILDRLAVKRLNPNAKGTILCLAGPPGVGKTSLGKSIARALGRKFDRMSLGGVKDEAELRGHRRTYVAALPGRIVRMLEKAGSKNPIIMLDEIDKVGQDGGKMGVEDGLLEVLDPEQNHAFYDHYMEVPVDISQVMFIATANSLYNIQPALLDRMEIIELSGYSEMEKVVIARRHLIPKQLAECGLTSEDGSLLTLTMPDPVLSKIVRDYTNEAGVRHLEKNIRGIFEKIARKHLEGAKEFAVNARVEIEPDDLDVFLGHPKIREENRDMGSPKPGIALMLMVEGSGEGSVGFIEVSGRVAEKFDRTISGNLKLVIEESVKVAMSRLMHGNLLPIDSRLKMQKTHFHVHFDEAGISKDGPSAGIMLYLGIASYLLGKPIKPYFTGTGEIPLSRNAVLPIGGVRSKILAAYRAGIKELFIPRANMPDLDELPQEIKDNLATILPEGIPNLAEFSAKKKEAALTVYCINTPEEALQIAFPDLFM